MSFSKYNKNTGNLFTINTDGFEYKKLKDLFEENGAEHIYHMAGCFINPKSKYGDSPEIITDGYIINLPKSYVDTVNEIRANSEDVQKINDGLVGFKIYTYESDLYGTCYGVEFIED